MLKGFFKCISVLTMLCTLTIAFTGTTFASTGTYHHTMTAATVTTCGGTCEGKDPYTYYNGVRCSDTAYIANSYGFYDINNNKLLTLQNWYSKGCQTNWALAYLQGNTNGVGIAIKANTYQCEPTNCGTYFGTASPLWTNMVVAPTTVACIDANAYDSRMNNAFVYVNYVACA